MKHYTGIGSIRSLAQPVVQFGTTAAWEVVAWQAVGNNLGADFLKLLSLNPISYVCVCCSFNLLEAYFVLWLAASGLQCATFAAQRWGGSSAANSGWKVGWPHLSSQ